MVQRLRAEGIALRAGAAGLGAVPRHRFVDSALATQAYEDTSLPIGLAQTISKPSVVARMLALLFEGESARAAGHLGRVLEIGTGCGYQAALLALLARSVVSIERLKPLHDKARDNLDGRAPWRPAPGLRRRPAGPCAAARPTTASSPRPAAMTCPRPGWSSWPWAGAWWRRCTTRRAAARCCWSSTASRRGWYRRWHDAVHFVPLKSGTA